MIAAIGAEWWRPRTPARHGPPASDPGPPRGARLARRGRPDVWRAAVGADCRSAARGDAAALSATGAPRLAGRLHASGHARVVTARGRRAFRLREAARRMRSCVGDIAMNRRSRLFASAFVIVAAGLPVAAAAATCNGLSTLQLRNTTITSAETIAAGAFTLPADSPRSDASFFTARQMRSTAWRARSSAGSKPARRRKRSSPRNTKPTATDRAASCARARSVRIRNRRDGREGAARTKRLISYAARSLDRHDEVAGRVDVTVVHPGVGGTFAQRLAGPQLELDPIGALRRLDRVAAVGGCRGVVARVGGGLDRRDLASGERHRFVGGGDQARDRSADRLFRSADDRSRVAGDGADEHRGHQDVDTHQEPRCRPFVSPQPVY